MSAVITTAGAVSGFGAGMDALRAGYERGGRVFTPWRSIHGIAEQLVCQTGGDTTSLAMQAALEALRDVDPAGVGIILGATTGDTERQVPMSATTNAIAKRFGLTGPRTSVVTACASSLTAIIMAKRWVESGVCERVLAVGADALCRVTVAGFSSLGVIDPHGMRPFHQERKGITLGEGAAAFLVEKPGRRPVLARLAGGAIVAEAHHPTHPQASGEGAERCMRLALRDAGMREQDISLISAHGTATQLNDVSEVAAVRRLFGERAAVVAHKSQLGHTLGAAGALETAVCVLMLQAQKAYPTYGLTRIASDCAGVDHVVEPRPMPVRAIMKNSFAFGGQNSALVLAC